MAQSVVQSVDEMVSQYKVFDAQRNGAYWEYWGEISQAMKRVAEKFFEQFGEDIDEYIKKGNK